MAKKRLLFIDGPLGGGGAERVLIDILRNIDYARFDVDLALICRGGVLMNEVPPEVQVIELWPGYNLSYKIAYRLSKWIHCNWLFSRKMNGKKLRRDYDIEISFLEGMPLKLGALRTTDALKATWVHADLFTHRYEEGQFYSGEEEKAYDSMDYVVNVSRDCEDAFRRRFPACKAMHKVIYNPIDRAKITAMASSPEAPRLPRRDNTLNIITVGRVTPPKKPERLLQVAQMAQCDNLPVHFTWVGTGERLSDMKQMRDAMGLQDMVTFAGFTKNPFGMIADADIMMVTSDFEGFCLVICEAMCLGTPVISTRTAGPCEIIGDNEYGILTDISADGLFHALTDLVNNPDKRRDLAKKAYSRPDAYSVDRSINAITSLLK